MEQSQIQTVCKDDVEKSSQAPRKWLRSLLALTFSLALSVAIWFYRDQLTDLSTYGYAGVFLIGLLGNATVVFPVPSLVAVFAGGSLYHPLLVGLVSGVAEPIGELTGYLAGYGGGAVIENSARYDKLKVWMSQHGFLTILVLSAIPNPVFDLAGIAAGALRFPVWKFLVACWLGKTLKAVAVAYFGSHSWKFIQSLLT